MTAAGRPLLVTRDPVLLDDLRRLCAGVGAEPDLAASLGECRRLWSGASTVVVGDDLVEEVSRAGLRRRGEVIVVTSAADDVATWRPALELGAERVVALPAGEQLLLDRLVAGGRLLGPRATVVGVLGGSGGAGASVLAAALAISAARAGRDPVLVDADPRSGGLDLVLGAEDEVGARWCDLAAVTGLLASDALRAALPSAHGVALLSVDRESEDPLPADALPVVVDSAIAAYGVVVLDLPRAGADVLEALVPRCDVVLLVVTGDVRGASAALRAAGVLRRVAGARLVVRRMPHAGVDPGEIATWLDLEVAAELPHDRGLAAALDRGDPPGLRPRSRLSRACRDLLASAVPA
jgi:secretion/DNA translocation related CpaE-like protein